ncbi:hypothetical protein [Leifsonia sp. fls2-241-R2A-40a]|uniref:hypothetical protein n=1 Tax=Leifsonia sp. fls2-241-R2A-40a TaxID=3040290 RepID=UPI00254FFA16|nr:hypothetical protein [Leifsonia sp. fls2-241-R2A-40a]
MSRRGWLVLVAATAVVAIVCAAVAASAIGFPAAPSRADPSPQPRLDSLEHPRDDPLPVPLRVPPRPTPTQVATVPAQPVDTLRIGDCLQLYPSKSAAEYPVVDCSQPHIAQLLYKGTLPQAADAPFPGTETLDAQVLDLCGAPGRLDWNWVAVWNEDVQIDLRYPETAAQWTGGARTYYCFIYTFSRHELTGSAVPAG